MRLVVFALASAVASGCFEEPRACYPGDYEACRCDSGEPGYAQCEPSGDAYGACGFCGTTPGLAEGVTAGAGGGGGGLLGFLQPCEGSEQCESGLCHEYPAKGTFCSMPCDSPDDCPPPSSGCNMMGICKAP